MTQSHRGLDMSGSVKREDIAQLRLELAVSLAYLVKINSHIAVIGASLFWCSWRRRWLSFVRACRQFFSKHDEWKPLASATLPALAGAVFICVSFALGGSPVVNGAVCLAGLAAGTSIMLYLLYMPSLTTILHREGKSAELERNLRRHRNDLRSVRARLVMEFIQKRRNLRLIMEQWKWQQIRASREYQCRQLLNRQWREMRGVQFEQFLQEVFETHGYVVETTAASGDQGVDLIIQKTGWRCAVQAKGYGEGNRVGNKAIQEVFTGRAHYACDACAVVTNSAFTSKCEELARTTKCLLIDSLRLEELIMGRYDIKEAAEQLMGRPASRPVESPKQSGYT